MRIVWWRNLNNQNSGKKIEWDLLKIDERHSISSKSSQLNPIANEEKATLIENEKIDLSEDGKIDFNEENKKQDSIMNKRSNDR